MTAPLGADDADDPSARRRSPLKRTLVSLLARVGWTLWIAGAGLLVATLVDASGVPYALSIGMIVIGFGVDRGAKQLERWDGGA